MKRLTLIAILCAMTTLNTSAAPDHSLYTAVLTDHVHEGRVDYEALKADSRLGEYLRQLASTDPTQLANESGVLAQRLQRLHLTARAQKPA